MPSVYARPSGCEPVRMSCWFGMSPTPLTMPFFSVSDICLPNATPIRASLMSSPWIWATPRPTSWPFALYHGPLPMRSRALTAPGALGAEVRVPGHRRAAPRRCRELLAVGVGAGEAAVVGAVALASAGDEERHRLRGWGRPGKASLPGRCLRQHEI